MSCPFCSNDKYKKSFYPKYCFNNKTFEYFKCTNCFLFYLSPLPDADDYVAMYPPSYQDYSVSTEIYSNLYKRLPGLRFSYGEQFDLIKKFAKLNASILDYGCGAGNFVINANNQGFNCIGAEFNEEYVKLLNEKGGGASYCVINDVLEKKIAQKFDVIRMSNVFEHLDKPMEVIMALRQNLNPNGIFLIEGPIEANKSLMLFISKLYFKLKNLIKPTFTIEAKPYHIFFSNAKNQRSFFTNINLNELYFATTEGCWPMPSSVKEAKGIVKKILALVAQLSIKISKIVNSNWGNTFISVSTPANK